MRELRKFHRVPSAQGIELLHTGRSHLGYLNNISLNGALVLLDGDPGIGTGDHCLLQIPLDQGAAPLPPLEISCQVVHGSSGLVGVRFLGCDDDAIGHLLLLVEHLKDEQEKLEQDMERIRGYLADYCGKR